MSVSIMEAINMKGDIEVEGTIQNIQRPQFVPLRSGEIAKVCNAELVDETGEKIRISFWNNDIQRIRNGVKILLKKGYIKIFRGKPIICKSTLGKIEILDFNPEVIFYDIAKSMKYEKNVKTFEEYYNYVQNLDASSYLGIKKTDYLEILEDLLLIKLARERKTKQNTAEQYSICHLHQKVGLSPIMIIRVLRLFGVEMTSERILRLAEQWKEKDRIQ